MEVLKVVSLKELVRELRERHTRCQSLLDRVPRQHLIDSDMAANIIQEGEKGQTREPVGIIDCTMCSMFKIAIGLGICPSVPDKSCELFCQTFHIIFDILGPFSFLFPIRWVANLTSRSSDERVSIASSQIVMQ